MPRNITSKVGELDKLVHWMQHVKNASKKCMVVTQHKKDRDVLKSLGCKNVVYPKEPEADFILSLVDREKECILLFDADRQSNSKCQKLRAKLEQQGLKVNTRFRKILFTEKSKTMSGILKYVHQLAGSERKHAGLPV
jgi:5S rRNA maturation endonuclease (ribonuclease M5)